MSGFAKVLRLNDTLPAPGISWILQTGSGYLLTQLLSFILLLLWISKICNGKLSTLFRLTSKRNTLSKIPGPPGYPLIGNLFEVFFCKDILGKLLTWGRQYNSYFKVQLGPKQIVMLTSPESVEKLLSSSDYGHLPKSDEYAAVADFWDEGLATSCGDKWKSRRKLLTPLFSYKCFPHFLEVFNRHSKHLVHELEVMFEKDKSSKPIEKLIYQRALQIISEAHNAYLETTMGVELNDTTDEFDEFFDEAERTKEYIWLRVTRPWYQINWIWKLLPFRRIYEANQKKIKDYILKVIVDARKKFRLEMDTPSETSTTEHKKVITALLESGLSDSDVREESHTIMSAGHETAAATLQFALMFLALNPEHQEKCFEEVSELMKDESKCPSGNFTMSSANDLKYIERCLKETLRIYPIAYLTGRKIRSPLKLDEDTTLPPGTTCVIVATNVHQNPDIYPEPENFNPSRFTPENSAARHPFAYIPFSAGPRLCLGYKFAMTEMKVVLARLLHQFRVTTTDKFEDVPLDASCVLVPTRGYNFILHKRNP